MQINKAKEEIRKLITMAKTIKQRNSLKLTIDYMIETFNYYYVDLVKQRINRLKKSFEARLN